MVPGRGHSWCKGPEVMRKACDQEIMEQLVFLQREDKLRWCWDVARSWRGQSLAVQGEDWVFIQLAENSGQAFKPESVWRGADTASERVRSTSQWLG